MISNIKFGSTYKINSKDNNDRNFEKLWKIQNFASKHNIGNGQIKFNDGSYKTGFCTIIAQDKDDSLIETFCANNGIVFKKLSTSALLKPEAIIRRIAPAPNGKQIIMINIDKLNQLQKNQQSNIGHCRHDYDEYYHDVVESMLRSGDPITTTTMYIKNKNGNNSQELIEYINKYGIDGLNKQQITIDFNQETDDPDHCVYFGLRNKKMKEIPVYVDSETYNIAQALGLAK